LAHACANATSRFKDFQMITRFLAGFACLLALAIATSSALAYGLGLFQVLETVLLAGSSLSAGYFAAKRLD
jgi:hypothetical protein